MSPRSRRAPARLVGWALAAQLACVAAARAQEAGEETVLRFSRELLAIPAGVGLGGLVLGALLFWLAWRCLRLSPLFDSSRTGTAPTLYLLGGVASVLAGGGLLLVAAFAGLLILPGMVRDRVVISETEIVHVVGWSGLRKGIVYEEVEWVAIASRPSIAGGDIWLLHRRDGTVEELNPGDLWDVHQDVIIEHLERRGVDVR